MDYPWGNISNSTNAASESSIEFELAKLRISANTARNNIESLYRDILGPSRFDGRDVLPPGYFPTEIQLSDNCYLRKEHSDPEENDFSQNVSTVERKGATPFYNCSSNGERNISCHSRVRFSSQNCSRYNSGDELKSNFLNFNRNSCMQCQFASTQTRINLQHSHCCLQPYIPAPRCWCACKCMCSACLKCHFTKIQSTHCSRVMAPQIDLCQQCQSHFIAPRNDQKAKNYSPKQEGTKAHQCNCIAAEDYASQENALSDDQSEKTQKSDSSLPFKNMIKCPVKVTVPEPFKMTIRDENEKPLKDLKMDLLRKQLIAEQEKEMQVSIHSNPVPVHTYIPIYNKMVEKDKRKKQMRKVTAEKVKEFTSHSLNKQPNRSNSVYDLTANAESLIPKARPLPKNILDRNISEALKTKEAMRKIRIKKRAEETLRKSNLPFSSRKSLGKSSSMISLERQESDFQDHHREKQRIEPHTSLSQTKCKEVMLEWNKKVSAINLHQSNSEQYEKKNYEERYKEFVATQNSPLSDVPVRHTASSMLRNDVIRRDMNQRKTKSETTKNHKRRKEVLSRLKMKDLTTSPQNDVEKKLHDFREQQKVRQKEYEKELADMEVRVWQQPLLIDRQAEVKKKNSPVGPLSEYHSSKQSSLNDSFAGTSEDESSISSDSH